jgi:hypothetical protein
LWGFPWQFRARCGRIPRFIVLGYGVEPKQTSPRHAARNNRQCLLLQSLWKRPRSRWSGFAARHGGPSQGFSALGSSRSRSRIRRWQLPTKNWALVGSRHATQSTARRHAPIHHTLRSAALLHETPFQAPYRQSFALSAQPSASAAAPPPICCMFRQPATQ